jgi:predicted GNAT superfamily acetyltransferase
MIAEYLKETKGVELFQEEHGFILFKLNFPIIYIRDVYVVPEHRRGRVAFSMFDKLLGAAKEQGFTRVMSDIMPSDTTATEAMKMNLKYGMKIVKANDDEIILAMDLV